MSNYDDKQEIIELLKKLSLSSEKADRVMEAKQKKYELEMEITDAKKMILRGIRIMTPEQVMKWEGVMEFIGFDNKALQRTS